ncbi:MAG: protein translocase subunit SecF [Anaerolineales bacterium]|nr:protein translocase subunit SecF [Anaerolineales bacterium]
MLNIVGRRYWYFAFSLLVIIPGLIAMGMTWAQTGQPFRLAIDFTGGTLLELKFAKPQQFQTDEIVKIFGQFDLSANDVHVQPSGNDTLIIRTKTIENETKIKAEELIRARFGDFTELRAESVGPSVGAEVAGRAATAVALATLAILLYITWAFRRVPQPFRYGVCAVIALVHDAFVVMGVAAIFGLLFGWEVDALFLTALMTVIGFSVHDTIVVFDRIRENLSRIRGISFEDVVNHSILQTLDRSINTVLTTLFVLSALILFGGLTIRQFALTLFIGIFSGMYSSIFNAAPLLVVWENNEIGKFFQRLTGKQKAAPA